MIRFLPIIPALGVFAGLVTFLGRLYLQSYYSYFGIPPSALELEVQDYAFGSFPLILFVLMVTVSVTIYWLINKPGLLGDMLQKFAKILIWPFALWQAGQLRDLMTTNPLRRTQREKRPSATGKLARLKEVGERISSFIASSSTSVGIMFGFLTMNLLIILILVFLALVASAVFLMIVFLVFSILGTGVSWNLIEHLPGNYIVDWDFWNIPGFRGLMSGSLLAAGTLLLISIIEAIMPAGGSPGETSAAGAPPASAGTLPEDTDEPPADLEGGQEEPSEITLGAEVTVPDPVPNLVDPSAGRNDAGAAETSATLDNSAKSADHRRWISPVVLLMVIITAMPIVTHFMARDQAIADLQTETSRFFSSLPVAVFTSKDPLAVGDLWSSKMETNLEEGPAYGSPPLKAVLINGTNAYVVLNGDRETDHWLFTIRLTDIRHSRYMSPVKSAR